MRTITSRLLRGLHSERGASMVEYALLAVLIAVVALVAITTAGQEVSTQYSEISSELAKAGN